ncbi:LuxR C-terminal-related transcriptional regulator [Vreelandella neptunia]
MGISHSTVSAHVESIFRKLNCAARAAATLKTLTAVLL